MAPNLVLNPLFLAFAKEVGLCIRNKVVNSLVTAVLVVRLRLAHVLIPQRLLRSVHAGVCAGDGSFQYHRMIP